VKLAEPIAILDTFTSGLGRKEILRGGCVRLVFYAEATLEDGTVEHVIVAKIVMPGEAAPEAAALVAAPDEQPIKELVPRAH
jgi:hypothetical protein